MSAGAFIRSAFRFALGLSAPISIGCTVTHRCNLHCSYCDFPGHAGEEMDTGEWKQALSEFARGGTLRFGFSGGEPLLRDDIGELISHARSQGTKTTLCSNGILAPERMGELRDLDIYTTSLDAASAEIHDAQRRSAGSFEKAIRGIEAALAAGKEVKTLTVLTPRNLGEVSGILRLADEMGFKAGFQPATSAPLASEMAAGLAPKAEEFHEVVDFLIAARKQGRNVLSSPASLHQMKNYPLLGGPGQCKAAGRYFGYVDPRGSVFPCHLEYSSAPGAHPSGREIGYLNAFHECRQWAPACKGCYIVPLTEMNMIFSLRPTALLDQVRTTIAG